MEKANLFNVSGAVLYEATLAMRKVGVPQAQTARDINLTPAAVSQYLKGTRGKKWHLKQNSKERIRQIVRTHYEDHSMTGKSWSLSAKLCSVIVDEVG